MIQAEHYSYRVLWSPEDGEYVALCTEFPALSYLHKQQAHALSGLTQLVGDILADMQKNDESVPMPMMERAYSGKFTLRLPPQTHQKLALEASEQDISLNRYICSKLTG